MQNRYEFVLRVYVSQVCFSHRMSTERRNPVDAEGLLKALFPESCRPSVRWVRDQQERRTIPFVRLSRLVFFDIDQVRAAIAKHRTVEPSHAASAPEGHSAIRRKKHAVREVVQDGLLPPCSKAAPLRTAARKVRCWRSQPVTPLRRLRPGGSCIARAVVCGAVLNSTGGCGWWGSVAFGASEQLSSSVSLHERSLCGGSS